MTVIRPNAIAGITSLTAQTDNITFHKSDGTLAGLLLEGVNFNTTSGVSTFANVSIADSIVHTGDTDTSIRFPTAGTFTIHTQGSERLRIDSGGKVGIGTDIPGGDLSVHLDSSDTGPQLRLTNGNGGDGTYLGRISTGDLAGTFFAGVNFLKHDTNDGEIRFRTKVAGTNQDILTIVDGLVGIGTDNPAQKLDVNGNLVVPTGKLAIGTNSFSGTADTPLSVRSTNTITTYGDVSANFSDSVTGTLYVQHSSGNIQLGSDTKLSFGSGTSATTAMTIDTGQNVNIVGVCTATQLYEGTNRVATTGKAIAMALIFG